MADRNTLLAHLAHWFNSAENIAIEALGYILATDAAREGLNDLIRTGSVDLARIARVDTQARGEGGIPDLAGDDVNGERRLLIEAKFSAGLTENQPNAYMDRLPRDGTAVLLFVVPDRRVDTLWAELCHKLEAVGKELDRHVAPDRMRSAQVAHSDKHLLLASWTELLNAIEARVRGTQEPDVLADIQQLRGLTDLMDHREFVPFQREDFSPDIGRRIRDYRRIYDAVDSQWNDGTWLNTQRDGTSGYPQSGYGRFLRFCGIDSWFGVYYDGWAENGTENTPFWLQLYSLHRDNLPGFNVVAEKLNLQPFKDYLPIRLKPGVGYDAVVEDVISQLRRIAEAIAEAEATD